MCQNVIHEFSKVGWENIVTACTKTNHYRFINKRMYVTAWPSGLKRRFYGDRVITIA